MCKPFTICTTNGYIINIEGPFYATQNDAEILQNILENGDSLSRLLEKGDKLFLDRGFRDLKDFLEAEGYHVLMPVFKGKRLQLTTLEANESRFVTKIRWTVEAVHGVLKQKYLFLDHVIDNKLLPKVGSYFKIAAFIYNQFGQKCESDRELSYEIIQRMRNQKYVENTLANEAEENDWFRKKLIFETVSSNDVLDFPEMTEKYLQILFTGSYQLSQAISYLAEILGNDGSINLNFVKDKTNILKVQIQSRHISRKAYRCFIEYSPNVVGVSGIKRYACECANGRRTVGCCSHVASIIYYLSHARYTAKIIRPAEILSHLFTKTNIQPVIEYNSDED